MSNENKALEKIGPYIEDGLRNVVFEIRDGQPVITGFTRNVTELMMGYSLETLHTLLMDMADAGIDVLLIGEPGVGKELAAKYFAEECRGKVLRPINCSAVEDGLVSSELFGYEKGAFTGAVKKYGGLIMAAHESGDTLFLDEIGDASDRFQAKILRYLETGDFLRYSSNEIIKDKKASVICATSKYDSVRPDLRDRFQPVRIPPLRERRNDIPQLIRYFWGYLEKDEIKKLEKGREYGLAVLEKNIKKLPKDVKNEINPKRDHDAAIKWVKLKFNKTISKEALSRLKIHSWPGNVRELKKALTLAPILCKWRGDTVLRINDFPNIPGSQGKEDKSKAVKFFDIKIKREVLPITTFLKIPDEQVLDDKVFEQILPKEYGERFWRYYVGKGLAGAAIERKFNGKIKRDAANKMLQKIRTKGHN